MLKIIVLALTVFFSVSVTAKDTTTDINPKHKDEVCNVVLKKLKFTFEKLRTGKITDKKTAKVANLLQTYRLFECEDEKLLFDVLACTNTQIMFLDTCRKVKWD